MRASPSRAAAALWLAGLSSTAQAQLLPPDDLLVRLDRFTSVRERQIPGYEAPGVQLGTFTLSPSVTGSANYTNNIYAQKNGKVSGAFFRVEPAAILQSNWSGRSLTASVNGRFDRYVDRTTEDVDAVNASLYGIQQFGDSTRVRVLGRYQNDRESREAQTIFALTQRPVEFQTEVAALGLSQRFANLLVSGEAGYQHFNFQDARLQTGTRIDEDFRDRNVFDLRVRAEVAQSPSLAYFLQLRREQTDYDQPDFGTGNIRGSTRYQLLGGARFELPVGARGEIGLGYISSTSQGAQYRSFRGFSMSSRVQIFPTDLTTVTLIVQRSVNDAGIPNSTGYLATIGAVQVDHELLRNFVLGATIQYEGDKFDGLDRRDRRLTATASGEYKIGRALWLRAAYDFIDTKSDGTDRFQEFARSRASIGIRYRV